MHLNPAAGSASVNHAPLHNLTLDRVFSKSRQAFTRMELLACLVVIALLLALALPLLANSKLRSDQAVCANNLRLVGRAYQQWANDHGGRNPAFTPDYEGGLANPSSSTITVPGVGNFPVNLRNQAWLHFAFMGRELQSPRVLVCPSDANRFIAVHFANAPGGLSHLSIGNLGVSYIIALHAQPTDPNQILSADRQRKTSLQTNCTLTGMSPVWGIANFGWNSGLDNFHGSTGNILLQSGEVEQVSNAALQRRLQTLLVSSAEGLHFLFP